MYLESFIVIAVVLLGSTSSDIISFVETGDDLSILLKSESSSKTYYIGKSKANALVASSTCSKHLKTLLTLETEEEFALITQVLEEKGVDSVWTSGIQTVTNVSTRYSWVPHGEARPMGKYVKSLMEPEFDTRSVGEFLIRKRRSSGKSQGPALSPNRLPNSDCDCKDPCPVKPNCTHIDCQVDAPHCVLEDRKCGTVEESGCAITHEPNCTVTCPKCTITRGTCTVTRKPCTVTPGKCETSRKNCTIVLEPCTVKKGECKRIDEGCEVIPPEKPCDKPPTCTCNFNSTCPKPNQQVMEQLRTLNCTDNDCTLPGPVSGIPCTGSGCPNPEPCKDKCCFAVQTCVQDIVCQPPPVICKAPIYHCLPSEVECKPPRMECDEPITKCEEPKVECPDYEKNCTEDIIVCPAPQTVCTPAVSSCTPLNPNCTSPSLTCGKPEVTCPDLPKCEVPDQCYNPNPCSCPKRQKRSIGDQEIMPDTGVFFDKEDVLEMNCLGIQQGQKWEIEGCEGEKWFVCE